MIYEIDFLDDKQLEYINKNIKGLHYIDGKVSNQFSLKKNKICFDGSRYYNLNNYCNSILNEKLYAIYNLKKSSQMYFLKYDEGDEYGYHIDSLSAGGVQAHYSLTCFLNDPSDYSGGELVIKIGNKEFEYKMNAGKAILYPTGLWHKINKVNHGTRNVFVCWIETVINNSFMRNYLSEFGNFIDNLNVDESTLRHLEHFRMNLIREYGNL